MLTALPFILSLTLDAGSVSGVVLDHAGTPVSGAAVCFLDGETGVPVRRSTLQPFTDHADDTEDAIDDIAFVLTDDEGRFVFERVEPGAYRLLAQSWIGAPAPRGIFEVNGRVVHVRGTAAVDVESDGHARVEIRPVGNATLVLGDHAGNDETLVMVSTEPSRCDPVLGFGGWVGPFLQSTVGYNRMPDGVTTFHGLPEGEVHVAILSVDNVPGTGAATVTLDDDRPMWVKMPFVAMWSDGVHSPPPDLAALTRRISELPPEELGALSRRFGPQMPREVTVRERLARMTALLDEEVDFADGARASGAEVMAALAYARMQRRLWSNGREPNPYRAAEVRPATAEELARPPE